MATTYKVLAQVNPSAVTNTTLYTVPTGTSAISTTLVVCNIGISGLYRVAVRPAGATLDNKHYIVYDNLLNQGDSRFISIGMTLGATDVVTVYASTANFSFNLLGAEL